MNDVAANALNWLIYFKLAEYILGVIALIVSVVFVGIVYYLDRYEARK